MKFSELNFYAIKFCYFCWGALRFIGILLRNFSLSYNRNFFSEMFLSFLIKIFSSLLLCEDGRLFLEILWSKLYNTPDKLYFF